MSDSGAAVPVVDDQRGEPSERLVPMYQRDETERREAGHSVIDVRDEEVPPGVCSPFAHSSSDAVR